MERIRILIADDHPVVCAGLEQLIVREDDLEFVKAVPDGHGVLLALAETSIAVVVMDISMPGPGVLTLLERIREGFPEVRAVVLTVHENVEYVKQVMSAGATGYVLKRAAATELIAAIRAVAAGGTYVGVIRNSHPVSAGDGAQPARHASRLSRREQEVLRGIALGHLSKEIAGRLQISAKSVETYKVRSMRKLGLNDRAEVIQYALLSGWLSEPEGADRSALSRGTVAQQS
ncbi:MAG TPA: response regulator transcription factor [Planctomycetaceae bacterium]|nr:response regulator transcription factor [Planctomycetaceae bacterium]